MFLFTGSGERERALTRLKSDRPSESRRTESVLAIFKKISSFFGRPSSKYNGLESDSVKRGAAFKLRPRPLGRVRVSEYATLDGMVLFT